MHIKLYFYVFFVMLSAYTLTGINFDVISKKNKVWEARLLVIILSLIMGYLLTNFIYDFFTLSKII